MDARIASKLSKPGPPPAEEGFERLLVAGRGSALLPVEPLDDPVELAEQPHKTGRVLALDEADQTAAIGPRHQDGVDAKGAGAGRAYRAKGAGRERRRRDPRGGEALRPRPI